MSKSKAKTKVKILFKSGNSIELGVDEFKFSCTGEKITELSWTNSNPRMMFISLLEVEAVFEIPPIKRRWLT